MSGQRICYIRVSTLDQHTERQLNGIEVDKTFTDKASGKDTKRPQLEQLVFHSQGSNLRLEAGRFLHRYSWSVCDHRVNTFKINALIFDILPLNL